MATKEKTLIIVQSSINAPIDKVWQFWTSENHIVNWNFASEDWHCPQAKNDISPGGIFSWRMEAKDGSVGFDFSGTYLKIDTHKSIEIKLDDDRLLKISFADKYNQTIITQKFEAEDQNPVELQQQGWQAILNNFKSYAEQQI